MSNAPGEPSRDYARQLQEKFELYLLGLIFTLLGLAVQTATFGRSQIADTLELAGWLSLLTSGLVGLLRMEKIPVAHVADAAQLDCRKELTLVKDAASRGTTQVTELHKSVPPIDIGVVIANRESQVSNLGEIKKNLGREIRAKYTVHKWSFVLGLCLITTGRAYVPAQAMVDSLQHAPTSASAPAASVPTKKAP